MKGIKKVVLEESMEISKGQNYRKSEGLCRNTAMSPKNTVGSADKSLKQWVQGDETEWQIRNRFPMRFPRALTPR